MRRGTDDIAITSGQQVLLPESTRKLRKERRVTVAVNSRDRNLAANANSNQFRWTLRRPLKDILSIELVNGCVPANLYNINTGWNTFTFGEEDVAVWQVTLRPGQYDANGLAAELQLQLNALPGITNTYTASVTARTNRLTVSATGGTPYTFYFLSGNVVDEVDLRTGAVQTLNTPARLLGFGWANYTSDGTLEAPDQIDPDCFLKRLYLYINVDNGIELNRIEMGAGRRDCFHILYLDSLTNGYYFLNKEMHTPIYISSPAPIARISTLDISLRDEFFRLVDLGNHDYTLLFEITYLD